MHSRNHNGPGVRQPHYSHAFPLGLMPISPSSFSLAKSSPSTPLFYFPRALPIALLTAIVLASLPPKNGGAQSDWRGQGGNTCTRTCVRHGARRDYPSAPSSIEVFSRVPCFLRMRGGGSQSFDHDIAGKENVSLNASDGLGYSDGDWGVHSGLAASEKEAVSNLVQQIGERASTAVTIFPFDVSSIFNDSDFKSTVDPNATGIFGLEPTVCYLTEKIRSIGKGNEILEPLASLMAERMAGKIGGMDFWSRYNNIIGKGLPVINYNNSMRFGGSFKFDDPNSASLLTLSGKLICTMDKLAILRAPDLNGERRLHLTLQKALSNDTRPGSVFDRIGLPITLIDHPNEIKRQSAPFKAVFGNLTEDQMQEVIESRAQQNGSNRTAVRRSAFEEIGSVWKLYKKRNGEAGQFENLRLFFSRTDVRFKGLKRERYNQWEVLMSDFPSIAHISVDANINTQYKRRVSAELWVGNGTYPSFFNQKSSSHTHEDLVYRFRLYRDKLLEFMNRQWKINPKRGVRLSLLRSVLPPGRFFSAFGVSKFVDFIRGVEEIRVAPNMKVWLRTEAPDALPASLQKAHKQSYKFEYYRRQGFNTSRKRFNVHQPKGFKTRMRVNEVRSKRLYRERVLNYTDINADDQARVTAERVLESALAAAKAAAAT